MPELELTNTEIYKLLKHPRQGETSIAEQISDAYMDFLRQLFNYLDNETDNKKLIRKLNLFHAEWESQQTSERSAPTPHSELKLLYLHKLLQIINYETDIVFRRMKYPHFFISVAAEWESPFHLNPEKINSTDMMEVVSAIFHIKGAVVRTDNKQVYFSEFAQVFEKMFNLYFGDVHKKEQSVIKRTSGKLTQFLDRLKLSLTEKSRKEGYR